VIGLIEIRWHGRGGQGVVTSSILLSQAAIYEGKYAIHIPEFGPERRGAPVRSYTRIDEEEIEIRYGVLNPDIVVVIDPTLISYKDLILEGVDEDTIFVFNIHDSKIPEDYMGFNQYRVDAYRIALDTLGRPIYNTAMLGALIGAPGVVDLDSAIEIMGRRFTGEVLERNIQALKRGYSEVGRIG